ncbi:hypothetical protein ACY3DI_001336 [Campylobacter coli]
MQYFCAEKENCCAVYIIDKNSNDEYIKKIKIKLKREETINIDFSHYQYEFFELSPMLIKKNKLQNFILSHNKE